MRRVLCGLTSDLRQYCVGLVVLPDHDADLNRGIHVESFKFKPSGAFIGVAYNPFHPQADFFAAVHKHELVFFAFLELFLRLHHEPAARELPQYADPLAFIVGHVDLGGVGDLHTLMAAALTGNGLGRKNTLHLTGSRNEKIGSISTGTLLAPPTANFNSKCIFSYLPNHASARARSPVASISSNSWARLATAAGMRS